MHYNIHHLWGALNRGARRIYLCDDCSHWQLLSKCINCLGIAKWWSSNFTILKKFSKKKKSFLVSKIFKRYSSPRLLLGCPVVQLIIERQDKCLILVSSFYSLVFKIMSWFLLTLSFSEDDALALKCVCITMTPWIKMYLVSFKQLQLFLKLQFLYLLLVGASSVWFLCPFDRIFAVCFLTVWCDQSFRLIFYIVPQTIIGHSSRKPWFLLVRSSISGPWSGH